MITVRKVEPIGSHAATGFLEYADRGKSGIGTVTLHDYPPSPRGKALREARHAADLTLGQAARLARLPRETST